MIRPMSRVGALWAVREVSTVAILVLEIAFFAWYLWPDAGRSHPFLNVPNALLILKYSSIYGIAAIGAAMVIIAGGIERIKMLGSYAAPVLISGSALLLAWGVRHGGGFAHILAESQRLQGKDVSNVSFWKLFPPALTANVGYWATLSLNIPDFTRYARSQRSQVMGQALGLPTTMTMFAFIGVAVTSATIVLFGEAIWDPVALIARIGSPLVIIFGALEVHPHHTPGHCPGGVCLQIGRNGEVGELFVGDTLFAGSIGRTDLPGGDYDTLIESIRSVLFAFGDEAVVHPGHGPDTTIGQERRTNPFLIGQD